MNAMDLFNTHNPQYEVPTPKQLDHGWWNCDDCRNIMHKHNIKPIINHSIVDNFGHHFTLDYVKDLLRWLEDREEFELCNKVKNLISKWEIWVKAGLKIPTNGFY